MGEVAVHALRNVNLDLYEGEFVVLLGPSGSGKSTLLNIIGGLDVPTSGEVFYRDTELTRADEAALTDYRRRYVGFVFQFYNLIPSLTAAENVALVTEISDHPMPPEEALRLVDLSPRASHFPAQLSGGEQQRVAIARAVAKRPAVLLCDEPTGALDISTGIVVLEALTQVNTEIGTTTVVITHNAAIAQMADRVIRLADGRVVAEEKRTSSLPPVSCHGDAAQAVGVEPQAGARSAGDEGPGVRDRDGRGRGRLDVHDVPLELRVAAGHAGGVLQSAAVCRRVRVHEACARAGRRGDCRPARGDGDRNAVVASVTLDLEQLDEPATARLVSIPADRRPRVNDLFLRRGRWIEPGRRDEVLASEGFVTAHGMNPGDHVRAVINGRRRQLDDRRRRAVS